MTQNLSQTQVFILKLIPTVTQIPSQTLTLTLKKQKNNVQINVSHFRFIFLNINFWWNRQYFYKFAGKLAPKATSTDYFTERLYVKESKTSHIYLPKKKKKKNDANKSEF